MLLARHPSPHPPLPHSVLLLPSMPIVPVYQITVHSALMELCLLKPGFRFSRVDSRLLVYRTQNGDPFFRISVVLKTLKMLVAAERSGVEARMLPLTINNKQTFTFPGPRFAEISSACVQKPILRFQILKVAERPPSL